jgi:ubiquinone biosynthesis protein
VITALARLLGTRTGSAAGAAATGRSTAAQWARLREISTLLWASGFEGLVSAAGLGGCVRWRCRVVCAHRPGGCPHAVGGAGSMPQRLVAVLEQLGPTFVKAGQLLAMRPDVIPAPYSEALRVLQDQVPPFPWEQAREILSVELGRPPHTVFTEFDEVPFAAASLCQVHRARLPDGRQVAVKVQRPGVAAQVEADLALLAVLARRLERRRGTTLGLRPTVVVAELATYTRRELDFRGEARTADTVRSYFEGTEGGSSSGAATRNSDTDVVVPWVEWDLTTARVLTMELIEGYRPAPRAELAAHGLDADRLLNVGARAMLRQIFDLGLFHADPHPGNLLMLNGNKVAFIDFGMFGRLEPRERRRMAMALLALVQGDDDVVADQLLHLSQRRPGADARAFRAELADMAERWSHAPGRPSVTQLLLRELGAGARHGIDFPRELVLLARSLISLEATAALIDPERTFVDLVGDLLPEMKRMLMPSGAQLEALWRENRFDYLALALELPAMLPHVREALVGDAVAAPATNRRSWRPSALAGAGVGAAVAAALSRGRRR